MIECGFFMKIMVQRSVTNDCINPNIHSAAVARRRGVLGFFLSG